MSTITKIDPGVRRERAYRRDTLRSLQRLIRLMERMQPPPLLRLGLASVTANFLRDVVNEPRLDGETKQRLFTNIINQLETTNESSAAESGAG